MMVVEVGDTPGWFIARGLSGRVLEFARTHIPAKDRFYQQSSACWYVRYAHLLDLIRIGYAQDRYVDYSDLPSNVQLKIAEAKNVWDVEDAEFRKYFRGDTKESASVDVEWSSHYATLHLIEDAPPGIVEAVWKYLARTHHPDRGGDEELFKKYQAAYSAIKGRR